MKNFEKYKTTKERVHAFKRFCKNNKCNECILQEHACGEFAECVFAWSDLEAEKPMDCPFCGSHVEIARVIGGEVVRCKCGYTTSYCDNTSKAVSAHNRICRAVEAAGEEASCGK